MVFGSNDDFESEEGAESVERPDAQKGPRDDEDSSGGETGRIALEDIGRGLPRWTNVRDDVVHGGEPREGRQGGCEARERNTQDALKNLMRSLPSHEAAREPLTTPK